ncbi:MAG: sigma-70 family RNA polymerase sigma factor [Spirochaetaceae bacterium]
MTDIEILKSIRSGNSTEFVKLYQKYFDKIYRYIYTKTYHKESAEDISSITFIKALENISKFKGDGSKLISWIYRIASNQVIDYYRKSTNDKNIDDLWDLSSKDDIEVDLINKDSFDSLYKYLHQLNKLERDIITLHLWEENTFKEIGFILKLSEGKCKMTYYRSLKKMRNSIKDIITILTALKPLLLTGENHDK